MWLFQKTEILLQNPILFVVILMDYVQIAYQSKTEKFWEYQQQNTGSVGSNHVELIRNWESLRSNQSGSKYRCQLLSQRDICICSSVNSITYSSCCLLVPYLFCRDLSCCGAVLESLWISMTRVEFENHFIKVENLWNFTSPFSFFAFFFLPLPPPLSLPFSSLPLLFHKQFLLLFFFSFSFLFLLCFLEMHCPLQCIYWCISSLRLLILRAEIFSQF